MNKFANKFKMGQFVMDLKRKEYVKISNGTAEIDGSNFVPTEAIALRFLGLNKGKPVLAYSYVTVNPEDLHARSGWSEKPIEFPVFDKVLQSEKPENEHYFFAGRI